MRRVVIFGAGEWGKIAYYYYHESCEIACYVDNDKSIWGTVLHGLPICPPNILKEQRYTVIIACKRYEDIIKKQLVSEYGISEVINFRIVEKMQKLSLDPLEYNCENELIIAFSDGLGNQMFQYALYKIYKMKGRNVKADLSAYLRPDMRPFLLKDIFFNIQLHECSPVKKEFYVSQGKVYIEEPPQGEIKQTFDINMLDMNCGYIEGWHCSYKYPEMVKAELLNDFQFMNPKDKGFHMIEGLIKDKEFIGVHVRRGDFLLPKWKRELGTICNQDYYDNAIRYIRNKISKVRFCFFSDDIEWVKNNMYQKDAVYIEKSMFDKYCDWYDMCLMSLCKHNIIPNSTFGWWGAWLNRNPNKIVVAPKKWRNRWETNDWCPPEWILF